RMHQDLEEPFPRPLSGALLKTEPSGFVPSRCPLKGRFIQLEPLDPAIHAEELYLAGHGSEALHIWDYLPHGPWSDDASFAAHLPNQAADIDQIRFVLRPDSTRKASGMASYMDPMQRTASSRLAGSGLRLICSGPAPRPRRYSCCSPTRWTGSATGACSGAATR